MDRTIWLTSKEAAAYAKVDQVTLRRAVKAGRLVAYRVNGGHRVRYRLEDLDRWLTSAPVRSGEPVITFTKVGVRS